MVTRSGYFSKGNASFATSIGWENFIRQSTSSWRALNSGRSAIGVESSNDASRRCARSRGRPLRRRPELGALVKSELGESRIVHLRRVLLICGRSTQSEGVSRG